MGLAVWCFVGRLVTALVGTWGLAVVGFMVGLPVVGCAVGADVFLMSRHLRCAASQRQWAAKQAVRDFSAPQEGAVALTAITMDAKKAKTRRMRAIIFSY